MKSVIARTLGTSLLSLSVLAADAPPRISQSPTPALPAAAEEQKQDLMGELLTAVLNNITQAQVDFQIEGQVEDKKGFQLNLLQLDGKVQFQSDVIQDVNLGDPKTMDHNIKPLVPKIKLALKGLFFSFEVEQKQQMTAKVRFYSGFDKNKQAWIQKPLLASVSNQLNSSLLAVVLHSIDMTKKDDPTNPDRSLIEGSCKSEKQMMDLATGRNVMKPVKCEFSGFLEKGNKYKVNFKYVNQK